MRLFRLLCLLLAVTALVKAQDDTTCVLMVDDFATMNPPGDDPFADRNLLGHNTGSDDTMGVEYDNANKKVTLEVWGVNSYWYSFLAEKKCFDISDYSALRFIVIGSIEKKNFRVGLQTGSGEECTRSKTYFSNWTDAISQYDAVNDITTLDFSIDNFHLSEEEKKNILAVELSGFLREHIHMKIVLGGVYLVKKNCANTMQTLSEQRCIVDVDDFSRKLTAGIDPFASQNLLGHNTGSDDTMGVEYDTINKKMTLEVWGANSYWYSFLAGRECLDLSDYNAIRLRVAGSDIKRFRLGLQTGKGEDCMRDKTYFIWSDRAVSRYESASDMTTLDFPLDQFGILEEEKKSILAIQISGFSRDQIHQKIVLVGVQLVPKEEVCRMQSTKGSV